MKYWIQRNGEEIAIKDMETSHLAHTIAMLERTAEKYTADTFSEAVFISVADIFPVYQDLTAEMDLRIATIKKEKNPAGGDSTTTRFSLLELD